MRNGRDVRSLALATHTPESGHWRTFETPKTPKCADSTEMCEFRQTMPRFSGFPHKKAPTNHVRSSN